MYFAPVSRYDVRNCISDYGRQVVALFIHIPDLNGRRRHIVSGERCPTAEPQPDRFTRFPRQLCGRGLPRACLSARVCESIPVGGRYLCLFLFPAISPRGRNCAIKKYGVPALVQIPEVRLAYGLVLQRYRSILALCKREIDLMVVPLSGSRLRNGRICRMLGHIFVPVYLRRHRRPGAVVHNVAGLLPAGRELDFVAELIHGLERNGPVRYGERCCVYELTPLLALKTD